MVIFVLWNVTPCSLVWICTSKQLAAIVKTGATGLPKRRWISTRLDGVTHQTGNLYSHGPDNVTWTRTQWRPQIRLSSSSCPECDCYGTGVTVRHHASTCDRMRWDCHLSKRKRACLSVCLSGRNNRFFQQLTKPFYPAGKQIHFHLVSEHGENANPRTLRVFRSPLSNWAKTRYHV
jgi:hypothetical protein